MTDLTEVEAFETGHGKRCAASVQLDPLTSDLSEADRATLATAVERGRTRPTGTAVERWAKSKGVNIGYQAVNRHRRGQCCHV